MPLQISFDFQHVSLNTFVECGEAYLELLEATKYVRQDILSCSSLSGRGIVWSIIPNGLVKCRGTSVGQHVQFFVQRGDAALILA